MWIRTDDPVRDFLNWDAEQKEEITCKCGRSFSEGKWKISGDISSSACACAECFDHKYFAYADEEVACYECGYEFEPGEECYLIKGQTWCIYCAWEFFSE